MRQHADLLEEPPGSGFERRVPARPREVAALRRDVVALARRHGFGEARADEIALAVSEAATNVVVHAYHGDWRGTLDLCAEVRDGALHVTVGDEGTGFRRRDDSPGLGLGLALGAALADDLRIQARRPRGTLVALRFDLRTG